MTVTSLISEWNDALTRTRTELADQLAGLPRLTLTLEQTNATVATTLIRYRLVTSPPPAENTGYRIRHLSVVGLDERFDEDNLIDEAARGSLAAPVTGEMAQSFARGGRAIIGSAIFVPALGCDAISGWQRIDIGR